MREFAASETMMVRQWATVPPIFHAVEFNWSKQLHDPLDPFTVEFMLSFATYLRNCTHAVKKLWTTALYIEYAFESELLLAIVSPLRSLSTAAKSEFV